MKNVSIVLILFCLIAFFSCEQEEFTPETSTTPEPELDFTNSNDGQESFDQVAAISDDAEADYVQTIEMEMDTTPSDAISLRTGLHRFHAKEYEIHAGKWFLLYLKKHQLDPKCKYIAKVTTIYGDPDLYIKGRDYPNGYRVIRRADIHSGYEQSYAYYTDLQHHEDRLYFAVYADKHKNAKFKIELFKDCNYDHYECCSSDPLQYHWLQKHIEELCYDHCYGEKIYCSTYNGKPAIHITPWTSCTDGIGYVYDCHGNLLGKYGGIAGWRLSGTLKDHKLLWDYKDCHDCQVVYKEDFQRYHTGNRIAYHSNFWSTWDPHKAGTQYDPKVSANGGTNKYLRVYYDKFEDVVYKLGNKTHGKYEVCFKLKMYGSGYFNVQKDYSHRVNGGIFQVIFENDGEYYIKTNGGGHSNKYHYPKHEWIDVRIKVDFHHHSYKVIIHGREFNLTTTQGFHMLGGLNFYAIDHADYLIDDIYLKECH